MARLWYKGPKSTQRSWVERQGLLRNTFSTKTNFGHMFHDAAKCKAYQGQNSDEYCFAKLTKLNKLNLPLNDKQIVDCVIEGVQDRYNKLCGLHIVQNLLVLLQTLKILLILVQTQNRRESRLMTKLGKSASRQNTNKLKFKCFSCNEPSHKHRQVKIQMFSCNEPSQARFLFKIK